MTHKKLGMAVVVGAALSVGIGAYTHAITIGILVATIWIAVVLTFKDCWCILWQERVKRPVEFMTLCVTFLAAMAAIFTLGALYHEADLIINNQDAQAYSNI